MKRRVLYLGIETKARELYGKILLASRATERGWQVLFGSQREVRRRLRKHGPPGVFVEISIPEEKADRLATYKALGHSPVNLCEENIVYYNGWDYCRRKVSNRALKHIDVIFASGARNESHLRQYRPEGASKIALTGNPRFDTLMPDARSVYQPEADRIRERHGRFLLVNTNFAPVNHLKHRSPDELIATLQRKNEIEDDAHADTLRRWYSYKFGQMQKLMPVLATIAASRRFERVIIRPHPSENHETWRAWAGPLGIEVRYENSANTWMLAAQAILHTGCTTGIEGVLLDRPVASFVPEPGHEMLNQADQVSVHISNADEFLAHQDQWRALNYQGPRSRVGSQRARLAPLIANVDRPMSVDRILDALDRLDVPEASTDSLKRRRSDPLTAAGDRFRIALKDIRRSAEIRQKYPGLQHDEIITPITRWVESGVLKRVPEVARSSEGTWLFS